MAIGTNSSATATNGNNNSATTIGNNSHSYAGTGNNNVARVRGNGGYAAASGGSTNTATVNGESGFATAGCRSQVVGARCAPDNSDNNGNTARVTGDRSRAYAGGLDIDDLRLTGSGNSVTVEGNNSVAQAGVGAYGTFGNNNKVTVKGDNSSAEAMYGNDNVASVTGNNSSALAGGAGISLPIPEDFPGWNRNTATVIGDRSHAYAVYGSGFTAYIDGDDLYAGPLDQPVAP
jgi:hypothetical protein